MANPRQFTLRAVEGQDRSSILLLIKELWGEDHIVVHEELIFPHQLPGFLALRTDDQIIGLITYRITGESCEIMTLNSLAEDQGVGTELIESVLRAARRAGCASITLTTTNDNQTAIDFYTNRGFSLKEIRPGAVDRARVIKPAIPYYSDQGIPITDEWVFERDL